MLAGLERTPAPGDARRSLQNDNAWVDPGCPLLGFADWQRNGRNLWAALPTLLGQLECIGCVTQRIGCKARALTLKGVERNVGDGDERGFSKHGEREEVAFEERKSWIA
jgi:hypothetical protein